jgi:putative transposase
MYSIKIRLYLNKKQQEKLESIFNSCRFIYNKCLSYKIDTYNNEKRILSEFDLVNYYGQVLRKDPNYSFLLNTNSKLHNSTILHVNSSFVNFIKHNKGFPKFKSKREKEKSCKFPNKAISVNFLSEGKYLNFITDFNRVRFRTSKKYLEILKSIKRDDIQNITVTKKRSGIYEASICLNKSKPKGKKLKDTNSIIGIDLGVKQLLTLSDNTSFQNKKFYKKEDIKLKKLQRKLSKSIKCFKESKNEDSKYFGKNKGKNLEKNRLKVARLNEKITNQKDTYIHEITSKIINENQVIIMEDLNVQGMLKNHKLARSIQNVSFYEIKRQLEYKSSFYGRELILVDRFFPSSKTCSCCGSKKKDLKLSDRVYKCNNPSCGVEIDRDLNAAINIRNEGIKIKNNLHLNVKVIKKKSRGPLLRT